MNRYEQIENLLDKATAENKFSNTQLAIDTIIAALTLMSDEENYKLSPPGSVCGEETSNED